MRKLNITKSRDAAAPPAVDTKKKSRLTLLERIEKIVELSENSALNDEFFEKAKTHINHVKRLLHLNDIQTVFLAHFLDRCDDEHVHVREISKALGCRSLKMLQYVDDINVLEERRLVRCRHHERVSSYRVPREVLDALRQNKEYTPESKKGLSITAFFDELDQLLEELHDDELTFRLFVNEVDALFDDNLQLVFVQVFKKYNLTDRDRVLLLRFCNLFVENADDQVRFHDIEDYFSRPEARYVKACLQDKKNALFDQELIECNPDNGFEDRSSFRLTDKAKNELLGELNLQVKKVNRKKDVLAHDSFAAKQMFYNERERGQVEQLIDLLREENFGNVRKRLEEKGMRTGFACLFHGSPGTGKTETVYQIARRTGRDLFLVDISETKSMWFGESEKKIKGIFEKYRSLVKEEKITPILLFNEADAVIGKRKDVINGGGVDQTENAMQNIILQEMENLDGIMIATTNLTRNLDKAFERRFLYKIEFDKPDELAKRHIWQSIIPTLQPDDAAVLSRCFDFSGGQIENVARKCTVDSIISGGEPDLEGLVAHCRNELLTNNRRAIGFNAR
jgi:ATP-dependent 26S proteasome regulatory subunit